MNIDSLSIPDLPKNAFHQAFFNVLFLKSVWKHMPVIAFYLLLCSTVLDIAKSYL